MDLIYRFLGWFLGQVDKVIYLVRFLPSQLGGRFFSNGYGDTERVLRHNDFIFKAVREAKSKTPDLLDIREGIQWQPEKTLTGNISIRSAHFTSPCAHLLPMESKKCRFYYVQPVQEFHRASVVLILLPGTGEAGKNKRLGMARRLAEEYGWSSVIVTAPFYAARRPKDQTAFFVSSAERMMIQGTAIMVEAAALGCYFLSQSPSSKVCYSGFSWGAAMSAGASMMTLACQPDGKRLACVPFVGCGSPSIIADGALESVIDWTALKRKSDETYIENKERLLRKLAEVTMDELLAIVSEQGKCLGSLRLASMTNDYFIGSDHSNTFTKQVMEVTGSSTDIKVTTLLGGHVVAALIRPWYQKRFIVEAVQALS